MSKTRKDIFHSNVQPNRIVHEKRKAWVCIECGRHNDAHLIQCSKCGAYEGEA